MANKRYWAVVIKQSFAALVIIFLIGVLFDHFNNSSYNRSPISSGAIACVIYIGLTTALMMIHALSNTLYLWLLSGDDMVDGILDEMRSLRLPPPTNDQYADYDYLNQLANDDEANPTDRVRAASFTGAYNVLMAQGIFRALSLRKALDLAVMRYSQEAPQRR